MEEALDGRADVVLACVVGAEKKIDEEPEERRLAGHPERARGHGAF